MTRARFVVRGLVQGVYFRAEAVREATARGLTGCVWNRTDLAVELIAEGDHGSLAEFERWLEHGPPLARVTGVERTDLPGNSKYSYFAISSDESE